MEDILWTLSEHLPQDPLLTSSRGLSTADAKAATQGLQAAPTSWKASLWDRNSVEPAILRFSKTFFF